MVLTQKNTQASSQSLGKNYLKTNLISKELSPTIDALVEIRQGSDYDDFYVVSKQEIIEQLENAKIFVNAVEAFLIEKYKE